jgi:hypothetical protein
MSFLRGWVIGWCGLLGTMCCANRGLVWRGLGARWRRGWEKPLTPDPSPRSGARGDEAGKTIPDRGQSEATWHDAVEHRACHWLCQCSPRRVPLALPVFAAQAKRSKKQNGGARNVNSIGQYRPFARSRAILQFAVRATGPQNVGRETRKITGKSAPLAGPRRAALAVPANRASQNHPPSGEKTQNPSRNSPPPLEKRPKNSQNLVSLATRRNSPGARGAEHLAGSNSLVRRLSARKDTCGHTHASHPFQSCFFLGTRERRCQRRR